MDKLKNFVLLLATATAAAPLKSNATTATIRNGTVVGSTTSNVDSFIGIPYAKPPVGELRLRPPQSIDEPFGRLILPEVTTACPSMTLTRPDTSGLPDEAIRVIDGMVAPVTGPYSEDCLSINVQRPTVSATTKHKLPVLLWIYGGGWEIGSTQDYDGTGIVKKSIDMGEPIVFVAFNYRLNAFGFLQGKELQREGSTNLGLRDQRKALEWVAENIAAFGGDPDRVTIWGESAGAMSVMDHLVLNGGDHTYRGKPLFRAAIMNSGTTLRTLPAHSTKAQDVFDKVATAAGCAPAENNNNDDDDDDADEDDRSILSCLRSVPFDTFMTAMNSVPDFTTSRSNDLSYVRRADPASDFYPVHADEALAAGAFARVPVIAGNLEDEATIFSLSGRPVIDGADDVTETLVDYLASWYPETGRAVVSGLVATYPEDPAAGLPARTGGAFELHPGFKRNAALQTDLTFLMGRRTSLPALRDCGNNRVWSYLGTFLHGAMPYWGTYHTADLAAQFALDNAPQPGAAFAGNKMDEAYIRFVNHLDPNGVTGKGEGEEGGWYWPEWDEETLLMANFSATDVTLMKDDFRWESFEFFRDHPTDFRQ